MCATFMKSSREAGIQLSYSCVKQALQGAGQSREWCRSGTVVQIEEGLIITYGLPSLKTKDLRCQVWTPGGRPESPFRQFGLRADSRNAISGESEQLD